MAIRMLCVVLVLLATCSCSRTPDDQRIRAEITAMRKAVEVRDPHAFLTYVTVDFSGDDGSVDREGLGNVLRAEVLRNESVGVALGPIGVELQGDRATVNVTATLTGGKGGLLPDRVSIYSITSGWRREKNDWLCYSARWEQKM